MNARAHTGRDDRLLQVALVPARSVIGFTFVLSVPFWVAGWLSGDARLPLPIPLPLSALMFVTPGLAAFVVTVRRSGASPCSWLTGRFRMRPLTAPGVLPLAIMIMPAVMAAPHTVSRTLDRVVAGVETTSSMLVSLSVVFLASALAEQSGWMTAADDLLERHGSGTTGLLLGVTWAIWHLPAWAQAGHTVTWLVAQALMTVSTMLIIVTLYARTGRCMLTATLVHASSNVAVAALPPATYDPTVSVVPAALVAVTLAVTLHVRPVGAAAGRRHRARGVAPGPSLPCAEVLTASGSSGRAVRRVGRGRAVQAERVRPGSGSPDVDGTARHESQPFEW